jgi:hypothetical protein
MLFNNALLAPLILWGITIAFGFWVKAGGRPYRPLSFNLHKLAALGGIILVVIRFRKSYSGGGWIGGFVVPVIIAGVSVILLFATGALMNIREQDSGILRMSHQTGSILIAFCLAWALYLLL